MPYTDYNQVLQDIADNIREANGTTASIRFVDMPELINSLIIPRISLQGEGPTTWKRKLLPYIDTSGMTDMQRMLESLYQPNEPLDLSHFDTSNVTNMSSMLLNVRVSSIDLSSFDTSNVTKMDYMFSGFTCSNSIHLDLSDWDTSKVTNMFELFYMFGSSASTASVALNVAGWDVSRVTIFDHCFAFSDQSVGNPSSSITELDLSGWNTSSAEYMRDMFRYSLLRKIWLPSTFVATGCSSVDKPFITGTAQTCHVYTDASSASAQGWGTISSAFTVHYNSTHTDYENA